MTTMIEGFVAGDDLDIQRDVTLVTPSDPLVQAWLTVKTSRAVADPGSLQKVLTITAVPGVGQITQDGSPTDGNGTASLLFQLTAADTTSLGTSVRYVYDIQVKTAGAKLYTTEQGRLQFSPGVTGATA